MFKGALWGGGGLIGGAPTEMKTSSAGRFVSSGLSACGAQTTGPNQSSLFACAHRGVCGRPGPWSGKPLPCGPRAHSHRAHTCWASKNVRLSTALSVHLGDGLNFEAPAPSSSASSSQSSSNELECPLGCCASLQTNHGERDKSLRSDNPVSGCQHKGKARIAMVGEGAGRGRGWGTPPPTHPPPPFPGQSLLIPQRGPQRGGSTQALLTQQTCLHCGEPKPHQPPSSGDLFATFSVVGFLTLCLFAFDEGGLPYRPSRAYALF